MNSHSAQLRAQRIDLLQYVGRQRLHEQLDRSQKRMKQVLHDRLLRIEAPRAGQWVYPDAKIMQF